MKHPNKKDPRPGTLAGEAPLRFGGPLTRFHFNLKTRLSLVIAQLLKRWDERKTAGAWDLRVSRNLDGLIIKIERLRGDRNE